METEIEYWITHPEDNRILSSKYWNDEKEEEKKDWYILDGNTEKLMKYLKVESTLFKEYESITRYAEARHCHVRGSGIDIAAGVCWTTALLSRISVVEKIYALEISYHRLVKIAPAVFKLFHASTSKIIRVLGNFYSLKIPDESMDFCFMSQAFHHASEPHELLSELKRVLKPNGFILIIGEDPISDLRYVKAFMKNLVKLGMSSLGFKTNATKKIFPRISDLFPVDKVTGDHHYHIRDYRRIFREEGFELKHNRGRGFITFLAIKG